MTSHDVSQRSQTTMQRLGRALALAATIAATAILGFAWAGDLEPPGPPAPTMKTLDQIPPTWSRVLSADDGEANGCNSSRFECVGPSGTWVLDHQTGLVWYRSVTIINPGVDWSSSRIGGLTGDGGWREPSIFELGSLRASANQSDPLGMPLGNPFLIPPSAGNSIDVWSLTSSAVDPSKAWFYRFNSGPSVADQLPQEAPKTELKQVLLVRASRPGMTVY